MRLLFSFLLILSLTGCMYQEADNATIRKAEYICGGVQNIDNITIGAVTPDSITCLDGTRKWADEVKIPKGDSK